MDNQNNENNEKSSAFTDKLKEQNEKLKEALKTKNGKIIALVIAIALFAFIITAMMNTSGGKYTVLYAGLDASETTEIFSILKLSGAEPVLSDNGEIMVLNTEFDIWLLQLASEGYPKSGTPNYSYYADNVGMTTTQAEMDQWSLYQLQEEIATTLKRINGISDASVLINLANTSDYIWDKATNTDMSSVAVMLTPNSGVELTNEQVISIKTLVAAGVPKVTTDLVKIINSRTSLEMGVYSSSDSQYTNAITALQNYELESIVQNQIEENVLRLLTSRYGLNGVVAVAKVTLNYDKMISESVELIESPNGGGFTTSTSGNYGIEGTVTYGGIVGEEDNTDIPTYPYGNIDDNDVTFYSWNTLFDYSYIKSQVEAGYAELERATISVLVDEEYISQERREELQGLISMSVDIPVELISISSINATETYVDDVYIPITPVGIFEIVPWYVFVIALVLLIIIVVAIILLRKRSIKKKLESEQESERLAAEQKAAAEKMLADYKNNIASTANTEEQDKQEAIIDEIRDFTATNPDIAAGLIRNWLKEEES